MPVQEIWPVISSVGTAIAAVSAVFAAGASWRSAKASERAARGSLVSKLHDEWWSYEIKKSKRILNSWVNSHEGDICYEKFGSMYRSAKADELDKDEKEIFEQLDEARRLIKAYFRKVHQLHQADYINNSDVEEILAPESRVGILLKKVEGFEKAKGSSYNDTLFEHFSKLHGKKRIHAQQEPQPDPKTAHLA